MPDEEVAEYGHDDTCPARPIRVTCSIGSPDGSWEKSEVTDIECMENLAARGLRAGDVMKVDEVCRERWAQMKALVSGMTVMGHYELSKQRDAVYAALADMARAESGAHRAQQRVDEAFPSARYARENDTDHRAGQPPSVNRLRRFIEHVIAQVGETV
jgi:hypothetical protein